MSVNSTSAMLIALLNKSLALEISNDAPISNANKFIARKFSMLKYEELKSKLK